MYHGFTNLLRLSGPVDQSKGVVIIAKCHSSTEPIRGGVGVTVSAHTLVLAAFFAAIDKNERYVRYCTLCLEPCSYYVF